MYIQGGTHAREWVSPATVTYFANELTSNPDFADLTDSLDWYFVFVHNPDGYEFSRSDDRMWRKTR
jgi:murein tripeptide amidase MpaA